MPVPLGGGGGGAYAYTPGRHARLLLGGGAHVCTLRGGARTPAPRGGRTGLRPLGVGRGSMLGGGISYPLLFYFFTFLGLKWALGWLYSPIESKNYLNE
jgi:hypothetical protein